MSEVPVAERRPADRARGRELQTLRITEIFYSLQGEARAAGAPTVFVRLTGCPLRCEYCDTAYAFHGGQRREMDDILADVAAYGVQHICVTGGEPLAQPGCATLVRRLCDAGYRVAVETSGALDIRPIDTRASRIVDLKTPGSGECRRNRWDNLDALTEDDQLKFVICDHADFEWAAAVCREHSLWDRCSVWFSPSHGQVDPSALADWILADRLPVRLQLQLHKQLWGDQPGR